MTNDFVSASIYKFDGIQIAIASLPGGSLEVSFGDDIIGTVSSLDRALEAIQERVLSQGYSAASLGAMPHPNEWQVGTIDRFRPGDDP